MGKAVSGRSRIADLLSGENDVRDLLEAHGIEPDPDVARAREQLGRVVDGLGETQVLESLFEFAGSFAKMADEIFDLAAALGVTPTGQIQVAAEGVFLRRTELNSGWAYSGGLRADDDTEQRAGALVATAGWLLRGVSETNVVRRSTEWRDTRLGRELKRSPDPTSQIMYRALGSAARRRVTDEEVSGADLQAIAGIANALAECQAELERAGLPGGVGLALAELEGRCRSLVGELEPLVRGRGRRTAAVGALVAEVELLIAGVRALVTDLAEAERARAGVADFVRSEFWFQRWRIYELWLLARVIRCLEQAGGEVTPLGVDGDVWRLPFGRAQEPIAAVQLGGRRVSVYYQLFELRDEPASGATKAADMPDIAVSLADPEERFLFVLDPKHGRSYDRRTVELVVNDYADAFDPDLTSVVNYYPVRSYGFDHLAGGLKPRVLASGIAPESIELRRLELAFTDVLLARGLGAREDAAAVKPARRRRRDPPSAAALLYWARRAREIDEPGGAWVLPEGRAPVHAPDLAGLVAGDLVAVNTASTGTACALVSTDGCSVLTADADPVMLEGSWQKAAWNASGTRLALARGEELVLFDQAGRHVGDLPFSSTVWRWSPWDDRLFVLRQDDFASEVSLLLVDTAGEAREVWSSPGSHGILIDGWDAGITLVQSDRLLVSAGDARAVVLADGTVAPAPTDLAVPFAVSPSGRWTLEQTRSLRHSEGVLLLALSASDVASEPTLIRCYGEHVVSPVLQSRPLIAWSADESRFAFEVRADVGSEARLLAARVDARHAFPVSLPGQDPAEAFGWIPSRLLRPFVPTY